MRVGDVDGDGDLDVVSASRLNRRIDWFENRHGAEPFVVDGVPDQAANAGIAYTYTIGEDAFDDLDDGDTLAYSAALADGAPLPGWLSFDPATATFSGAPTVADIANLEIEVTAEDSTGATGSDTFSLAVIDASGAPATQVTHTGDSGAGSLRQVIADAAAGDTVTFAPDLAGNTITLTSSEIYAGAPAIQIDKSLTIDGDLDDDGAPDITVSGNGAYAHFLIDDGDASYSDVIIDGLVMTDGWVDRMFGFDYGPVTTHENLELRNCVIKDSSGPRDGFALWAEDGETLLHGCEVKNNSAYNDTSWSQTGPLYLAGTRAEVVDCNIHGNSGYYLFGSGISTRCDLTVRNTSIRNNIGIFGDQRYLDPALDGSGGGGIFFSDADGSLVIEDTTISGNITAAGTGGGVHVTEAAAVTVRDSRITHNYALGSGGLRVGRGGVVDDFALERCVISGNTCGSISAIKWGGGNVDYYGSGIWLDNVTSATIDACTISDNMTPEYTGVEEAPADPKYYAPDFTGDWGGGSGIYADGGTLTLRNSTLSGNTTYAGLGAIHRADTGGLPVYNIATPTPGGLYMESGSALIQNCTFFENAGGGVIVKSGTSIIESSIFSGNIQSDVGDAYPVDLVNSGGTINIRNSLIKTATGGHGLIDGENGNIVGVDPKLGTLADNGGPTQTQALLPGSPAIDTGSNPENLSWDQRGEGYYREIKAGSPDMGAFEVQSALMLTVVNGTGGAEYAAGTEVNIQADSPPSGQEFDQWTGDTEHVSNVNSSSTTVTMPASDVSVTATYEGLTYTVSASAGAGGSISPGSRTVSHGESTTFTVSPDQGYEFDNVTGCDGNLSGDIYTTGEITKDCTVEATFFSSPIVDQEDPENPGENIEASVGRGSSNWRFTERGTGPKQTAGFIPVSGHSKSPDVAPPADYDFPHGLFDFVLHLGDKGSDATITIDYPDPLPANTVYWKYGSTPDNSEEHWYTLPDNMVSFSNDRRTITLTIKDGSWGDGDLEANSIIVDPGGPGAPRVVPPQQPASIPTLTEWGMIIMSLLFVVSALYLRGRRYI